MLFTSYNFLIFLAAVCLVYYLMPAALRRKGGQWKLLLVASYFFYFMASPWYLIYIGVTTLSTYGVGLWLQNRKEQQEKRLKENKGTWSKEEKKAYKAGEKKKQWHILLLCLVFNLGILAVVKYTNFVISNVNSLMGLFGSGNQLSFLNLLLPMGISFYTFQSMGYIIDVYRAKYPAERNLGKFALFVSFFPQLIQGPISRFDDLSRTLYAEHPYDGKTVAYGLQRVLWGYFKKLVIADRLLPAVTTIIQGPEEYQGIYVLVGMLFYAFELYADFTGGIDITIGVAQTLGIKVAENFRRPYFSKCIKEYWNRWHITMGSWFTDYIFYPISVCQPMLKLSKFSRKRFGDKIGKRVPVYLATMTVWFTTGIWHGSSWNFIAWGVGNGIIILISQELEPLYEKFHRRFPAARRRTGFRLFQVVRTVLLMSCLRMFDCYRDVPLTFRMFGSMFTTFNWDALWNGGLMNLGLSLTDYAILAFGLIIMTLVSLWQRGDVSIRDRIAAKPMVLRYALWFGLFLLVLLWGAYGIGYDANQFIYNQF